MTQYKLKKTKTEESIMNAYKRMEERIVASYFAPRSHPRSSCMLPPRSSLWHFLEKVEDGNEDENEDADAV